MFYPIHHCLSIFNNTKKRRYEIVKLMGFKLDIFRKNTPFWVGTTIAIIPYQEIAYNGIIEPNSTDKVIYGGVLM